MRSRVSREQCIFAHPVTGLASLGRQRRQPTISGPHTLRHARASPLSIAFAFLSFSTHRQVRFILLDAYDVSILGWPLAHPRSVQAWELLEKNNINKDKNHVQNLADKRWAAFNG